MKKYQRMISMASRDKIYHQSGCPYIKRIKDKNSVIVLTKEERKMGYRACKCCNTGNFVYKHYDGGINRYAKSKKMEIYRDRNELFIKTSIGIWKIVYLQRSEKFILYHGNNGFSDTPVREGWKAIYHRQMDQKETMDVMDLMTYIYGHDRYRRQVEEAGGNEMAVPVSKKYAKQRSNRMRRQERNRMAGLFAMIERDHPEYKALTIF